MSLYRPLLLALTATSLVAAPAAAAPPSLVAGALGVAGYDQPRTRDQDRAFRATREGRSMPLPLLERRVRPHMGGADYLGPELHGETYRLKYMQDGRVIWVDVDAATGRIVRKSDR
jgi:hypothetical protein